MHLTRTQPNTPPAPAEDPEARPGKSNKIFLPPAIAARYVAPGSAGIEEQLRRVAAALATQGPGSAPTSLDPELLFRAMISGAFLPAGRTIRYAPEGRVPPSCCVLSIGQDTLGEDVGAMLTVYRATTGFGCDFSGLPPAGSDYTSPAGVRMKAAGPAATLRSVAQLLHATSTFADGREHGNAAVLDAGHPDALAFLGFKDAPGPEAALFCLDVAMRDDFLRRASEGDPEARRIFDAVVDSIWRTGEPAVVFPDVAAAHFRRTWRRLGDKETRWAEACPVPCGEQWLLPGETCNLGAINLALFCGGGKADLAALRETARLAAEALAAARRLTAFPIDQMAQKARELRRVGLGVMGWANMLAELGLGYGSAESCALARAVMTALREGAAEVAEREGFVTSLCLQPTGGISRLAAALAGHSAPSGPSPLGTGIEPFFGEALAVPPRDQVEMMACFQAEADQSVSKTINLPAAASREEVAGLIWRAHELGCHGLTMFRDGCRGSQPVELGSSVPVRPGAVCAECVGGACPLDEAKPLAAAR